MDDCKLIKYYARKRRKNPTVEQKDRLSSLPNDILSDILSLLPIHSAAATSILSHSWRHLWTTVTRLQFGVDDRLKTPAAIDRILRQVSSLNLSHFDLDYSSIQSAVPGFSESESWFREICCRNVENFSLVAAPENAFRIPACLLNSNSLVSLKLYGLLNSKLPRNGDLSSCSSFHLPNLKVLALHCLDDVRRWLNDLIRSCPQLEDLHLAFKIELDSRFVLRSPCLNIIAPKLKSLFIRNMSDDFWRTLVSIDAPELVDLEIHDWVSTYSFVHNPTSLVKACVELCKDGDEDKDDYTSIYEPQKKNIRKMTEFVGGLSTVSKLVLKLDIRFFKHGNSLNLPVFSNVVRLETNCFKDLMLSSRNFPNLEHLEMCSYFSDHRMEERSWCAPDSIPDFLSSKLRTIQIRGLRRDDNYYDHKYLAILAYILSNALVLKRLLVGFRPLHMELVKKERDKATVVWKRCKFCRSLFNLPKSSSDCEVVVSGCGCGFK